jgi:hypothetical protein
MNKILLSSRVITVLTAVSLLTWVTSASGQTPGSQSPQKPNSRQSTSKNQSKKTIVATVFGEELSLEAMTPAESEIKRKEMPLQEFNEWLRGYQVARIYDNIWGTVSRKYIEQEKLTVSDDERNAITASVERQLKDNAESPIGTTLTPLEMKGISIAWARASLIDWKLCKSLYQKYGGRVGMGSLGAWTALDGQHALLREHHKAGDVKFHQAEIEAGFWEYAQREHFADTYPKGERLQQLLSTPPYLQADKTNERLRYPGSIVSHIDSYGSGTGGSQSLSDSGKMVTGFDYGDSSKMDWKGSIRWQFLRRDDKADVFQVEWDYEPKAGTSTRKVEELSFDGVTPAKLVVNEQWVISIEPSQREHIGSALGQDIYRDQLKSSPPTYSEVVQLFMAPAMNEFREQQASKFEMTDDEVQAAFEWLAAQAKAQGGEQTGPTAGLVNLLFGGRKFEQYLYDHYGGGRIIHQQFGPEALDARRKLLLELEQDGKFQITDAELRRLAYDYWERPNHPGGFHTDRRLLEFPWTAAYQEMIRENETPKATKVK